MEPRDTEVPKKASPRPKFNRDKFRAAMLYIISKCSGFRTFGKTVLWKLLYFADFDSYELTGAPITGETYCKLEHGPAPRHFDETIAGLKSRGLVREERARIGRKEQMRFFALAEPDLSVFDGREKELLDRTIAKLSSMNATQISELSHRDMPWKATRLKGEIDYELVFYRDDLLSITE